jgi:hypothetical protein
MIFPRIKHTPQPRFWGLSALFRKIAGAQSRYAESAMCALSSLVQYHIRLVQGGQGHRQVRGIDEIRSLL